MKTLIKILHQISHINIILAGTNDKYVTRQNEKISYQIQNNKK